MRETHKIRADVTRALYAVGGIVSLAVALAAIFALYQMLGSEFWTRALGGELLPAPPALLNVSLVKALEILVAVIVVHALLSIAGVHRRDLVRPASFALLVLSVSVIGFLANYNNAASAAGHAALTGTDSRGEWKTFLFAAAIFFSVVAIASLYLRHSVKCFRNLRASLSLSQVSP